MCKISASMPVKRRLMEAIFIVGQSKFTNEHRVDSRRASDFDIWMCYIQCTMRRGQIGGFDWGDMQQEARNGPRQLVITRGWSDRYSCVDIPSYQNTRFMHEIALSDCMLVGVCSGFCIRARENKVKLIRAHTHGGAADAKQEKYPRLSGARA